MTATLGTCLFVASVHGIHIGRRSSEVAQVAFEVGLLDYFLHFAKDALLATRCDKLALMHGDGAEGASAEAPAMNGDGVLNHVEGRYALAFVFGVGQTGVGQLVNSIELFGGERRIGRVYDDESRSLSRPLHKIGGAYGLDDALGVHLVGFNLYVPDVLGLGTLGTQALFVRMEDEGFAVIPFTRFCAALRSLCYVGYLRNVAQVFAVAQSFGNLGNGFLSHAGDDEVGSRLDEDGRSQTVLPIVVVGESAHRSFNASEHDGHVGEELFEDFRIDDGGVFWSAVVSAVGAVGVFRA